MAMIPERSNGLRNFALPRWGMQRYMKCSSDVSLPHDDSVNHQHQQQTGSLVLESVRSSVMAPLQLTENNQPSPQLRKSPPPKSAEKGDQKEIKEFKENIVRFKITETLVSKNAEVENKEEKPERFKPLILRKRKPLLPIRLNNEDQLKELRTAEKTVNSKRGRGVMAEAKKIAPLKVSLSRKEIEEDFIQILGHLPHCRPKKRPRNVQKALDNMFPGLHLNEVTADLYKVRDQ